MSEIIDDAGELATLMLVANDSHATVVKLVGMATLAAVKAGRALARIKLKLNHGEWLPYLKAHFKSTPRTAQAYMTMARLLEHMPDLDPEVGQLSMQVALE